MKEMRCTLTGRVSGTSSGEGCLQKPSTTLWDLMNATVNILQKGRSGMRQGWRSPEGTVLKPW